VKNLNAETNSSPPTPFSWKKEKGEQKKAAKAHNANLMKENSKSPSLPSKRGI